MKNTKREVVERLVAFNYGELTFLSRLLSHTREQVPNSGVTHAVRALVERTQEKVDRALNSRFRR